MPAHNQPSTETWKRKFILSFPIPGQVPANETRYIVGCCLPEEAGSSRLEGRLQSLGYSVWTFPECSNAVVTEFPNRSPLSVMVAPLRVYYALNKYIKVSRRRGRLVSLWEAVNNPLQHRPNPVTCLPRAKREYWLGALVWLALYRLGTLTKLLHPYYFISILCGCFLR